jgi:acyl-CoA dehydrogenase
MDALLSKSQLALRDEARQFVRQDVSRQLVLDMDAGRVTYPRHFVEKLASRRLLGLRFPENLGGRRLGWVEEVLAL